MIDSLVAALDELVEADPSTLADGESMVELHRQLCRLEAVMVRATAAFDAGRQWAADGAKTSRAWLTTRCRIPKETAARRVRLGRALRDLPHAEAAWLAGDIDSAHVAALARARTERTAELMDRDEQQLVESARTMRFSHFARVLDYWCQHADPDGSENDAHRQRDERRFDLSQTFQGTWVGDIQLDRIAGTIVAGALRSIDDELFKADWADARRRLGRGPTVLDLARTPTQRRADALVELATRALTAPAGGRRPEPLFSVLVGYETFHGRICELANGTVLTPGALLPWLNEAWIERVVFDSPSRVIDIGVTRRFFTGATRRAIEIRDGECFHNTCEEPAEHCEIDHIHPAEHGGPTIQTNGRAACGYHNRQRHRRPDAG